ncbi:UNVERIFIED_CONTAM: Spastin [Sesamum latifolium]|uniref:Spastin n=2 Tax=Sesamum TaxID=4181 RepID=A0AAW2XEN1_9LAMI
MEQKQVILSALSVGVGVGVGLGLVSGSTLGRWTGASTSAAAAAGGISADEMQLELLRLVVDGKESKVTFDDFPYYLSPRTRVLLTSAAYVHLNHLDVSKHTRNLSPASRAILLSGPAELYQQMLAKALAHHFEAKLLLLDITDFSLKMQSKYGIAKKDSSLHKSISEATLERMSSFLGSSPFFHQERITEAHYGGKAVDWMLQQGMLKESIILKSLEDLPPSLQICAVASVSSHPLQMQIFLLTLLAPSKRVNSWSFDEKVLQSLISRIILYIRDVDRLLLQSSRIHKFFDRMLKELSGSVLVLGSRMLDPAEDSVEVDDRISLLFPYNIEIRPPEDENHLVSWKAQLEEDMKKIQFQDNKNHIAEVLAANDLECDDLGSICDADTMVLSNYIDEIVISAISYHLTNNKDPEYRNGKLLISADSLSHGLSIFQEGKSGGKYALKMGTSAGLFKDAEGTDNTGSKPEAKSENKNEAEKSISSTKTDGENASISKPLDVPPDNEFEKRIRPEVIPANEIGVTFADIGALDEIKESLQELVMLPLRRPDLFNGGLLKPCRGILLFGPPGTGKTMLAKAIANEAGASFINVSMSTITSKWFGEDEKNVRALFTLAAKVSPTIIFVDEVDSMLGQRTRVGEHEAMRKIKNEFMTHWDGLLTKPGERILVLAATNRPFDLDEAIIRRFERRIMVGLPSVENREMILRTLLSKEKAEDIDFKELAVMTEGYSGSDLKNLCVTAAYRPVRELIQQEREKDKEKKQRDKEGQSSEDASAPKEETKEEKVISLRPLNMEDMRQAKNQVAASFASEGSVMAELKQWNELYGEGGSRKKQQLSYFL